jgi:hypothetical protein
MTHRTTPFVGLDRLESRTLFAGYPLSLGGLSLDEVSASAIAPDGSIVVAGLFGGTADFQPGSGQTLLTARGDTDVFVARYSPRGKLLWVGQIGGIHRSDNLTDRRDRSFVSNPSRLGGSVSRVGADYRAAGEYASDVAIAPDGSIYLVGSFLLTADLDPTAGVHELTAAGPDPDEFYDGYIVKLDADGAFLWAGQIGGRFNDTILGVATDAAGNPHLSGYFTRVADFNPGPAVFDVVADGRDDAFVAQFSSRGKLAWLQTWGSDRTNIADRESANDIALDADGNVYAAGTFAGRSRFGRGNAVEQVRAVDLTDAAVVSYAPDGRLRWVRATGGERYDGATSLAVVGSAVYTAGYFEDTFFYVPGSREQAFRATGDTLGSTSDRRTDAFVSRWDTAGNLRFARQLAGTGRELMGAISADENGVVIAGSFWGTADFDPLGTGGLRTSVAGRGDFDDRNDDRDQSYDGFVWRLSASGRTVFSDTFGSSGDDHALALTATLDRVAYAAGRFQGANVPVGTRGTIVFRAGTVSSVGDDDGLVALLRI